WFQDRRGSERRLRCDMFSDIFVVTDARPELLSPFSARETIVNNPPAVGVYNDGLVTIVDSSRGLALLKSWEWLIGPGCKALVTTGFGDAFFWKPNSGVNILDVQHASAEYIDREASWFLNEFLTKAGVIELVLRQPRLNDLLKAYRALKCHESFI